MRVTYNAPRGGETALATSYGYTPAGFASPVSRDAVTHFARLERALSVALASADYSDAHSWTDALGSALMALANANSGATLLPGPVAQWRLISALGAANQEGPDHAEVTERLGVPGDRPRNQPVAGDAILWARDDVRSGEVPRSVSPFETRQAIGLRVRAADGTIAAVYVRRDASLGPLEPQVIVAFRAIAAAFQAGVNNWVRATALRANVEGMLGSLSDAALLFDADGTLVYANSGLNRLGEQISARLREEAQRLAWSVGAFARRRAPASAMESTNAEHRVTRTVRIGTLVYRLCGSMLGEQLFGARPAVLVMVTSASAEPLTDDTLRAQYALTAREIEVARLIAEGLSNNEIAERIGVRFFTARNHVERTLAKLGVTSRHRVGPLLRCEAA